MELSINLGYIMGGRAAEKKRSLETAAHMCTEGGIRYVDYISNYAADDWEKQAYCAREILDKEGLIVEQSHAPYNRYGVYASNEEFLEMLHRSFVSAKILGSKHVVVHADEYHVTDHWDVKEIIEFTYDYLAPEAEYCAANGMNLAIENVFEDGSKRHPPFDGKSRFCSRIDEHVGIIERFNAPCVRACWDFGHASCAYGHEGMTDALHAVGKYLVCTHVHDNNKRNDQHLMPYMGETCWQEQMRCLKDIGYQGKLSYEFVYGNIPDDMVPTWMKLLGEVGSKLIGIFDAE